MEDGEFKIEKGVQVPLLQAGRPLSAKGKMFKSLKKGESVFCEGNPHTTKHYAIRYIGKGNYASRFEVNGLRIWRIK